MHPADMKLYYPLRGEERKNTQAKLATMTPRQFEIDAINAVDVELVRAGNMQELRPLHVHQKAKFEVNCQYDLTLKSLDLQDLMQLWVNEKSLSDPYLRHASDLNATMFSEETIKSVGHGKILRADATGNCCRAPAGIDYKRVLLYAFVVFICGIVVPILKFITSEHGILEISITLKRFRFFVEHMENGCWPYFNIVIIDWSWAFIHSILREWNNTDIYEYLRKTCNYALHGVALPTKWMLLHNCSVHFLKRVSDRMEEVHKSFAGKDFVMDCMAFMVQCKTVKELDAIFDKMITVVVTPFKAETSNVRDDLYEMRFKGFKDLIGEDNENDPLNEEKEEQGKRKGNKDVIYKDSPFYARYLQRLNNFEGSANSNRRACSNERVSITSNY